MKTSILYLSYDGLTDPLGQSQILPYLGGLAAHGHHITIVSFEKQSRLQKRNEIDKIVYDAGMHWHPLVYTKNPPVVSKLYDLNLLWKKAKEIIQSHQIEVVHCRSYMTSLIGLRAKRKLGTKFIFDMRGFWADERVDGGLWNLGNPMYRWIYKYFKRREADFVVNADAIVSLTEAGKEEMGTWSSVIDHNPNIDVIPCCVDTDLFDPDQLNGHRVCELKTHLGVTPANYILTYLGSIGTWYMLDEMLAFFIRLQKQKPDAMFLFISPQSDHSLIEQKVAAMGIKGSCIWVEASRKDVPNYLALSDASIFFIKPCYSKLSSSPTKQGEIMSMGIPVICNSGVGDTSHIVKKYSSGISIDNFNDDEFDFGIQKLLNEKFESKEIRKGALDYFSLKDGVFKYREIYRRIEKK